MTIEEVRTETATCPRCNAPLRPGQEWCLNCGAAVTREFEGARGWRTPVAIVAVVLVLAGAALIFAFLEISDDAERVAQAPTPSPAPSAAPAVPTPTPTPSPVPTPVTAPEVSPTPSVVPPGPGSPTPSPTPGATGAIGEWPEGEEAWTVVLWSAQDRSEAEAKAEGFQSSGKPIGILDSDDFESLRAGYFVVFSGQFEDQAEAQKAADELKATAPGAYARLVTPR